MTASKIRKGSKIVVNKVVVRVTRREKWNSKKTKIHFEDCGNGLPQEWIGVQQHPIQSKFFESWLQIEVL